MGRERNRGLGSLGRGQVRVLGVVLLVGGVVTASVGLVALAGPVLETHESSVEREQAQRSMAKLASDVDDVRHRGDGARSVVLGRFDHGVVETDPDAGRVRIVHVAGSETVLYDEPLGAVRYVEGDAEIAYQGGALWRVEDERVTASSDPAVGLRDETLSLPIVRVTGNVTGTRAIDGVVRRGSDPTVIRPRTHRRGGNRYEPGYLRIAIESAYCDGWERHLANEIPDGVVEGCDDGTANRLVVVVHVPDRIEGDAAVIDADDIDVHDNAPPIEGDVRATSVDETKVNGTATNRTGAAPSADGTVEAMVAACDGAFGELEETVTEPGLYCTDRLTEDHEFDTSAGDIEVVVRDGIGDPNYAGNLSVSGRHNLTLYVDGDVNLRGNARVGDETDPSRTALVLSSAGDLTTDNGNPTTGGVLYAPESTVSFRGSPSFTGRIVAERVEIGNIDPGRVEYEDGIADLRRTTGATVASPDHLQVTAYEVRLED